MYATRSKLFNIFLITVFVFESCSAPYLNSNSIINSNKKLISNLKNDDSKDTFYFYLNPKKFTEKIFFNNVKRLKTNPIATEIIINNSDRIEIIYLYTQTKALDNFISNDEITPLLFLNNKFIGKGWKMRDSIEQNSKLHK
jgi:hypothetical protein